MVEWLLEPGKWNDLSLICGVLSAAVFVYLIVKDEK